MQVKFLLTQEVITRRSGVGNRGQEVESASLLSSSLWLAVEVKSQNG